MNFWQDGRNECFLWKSKLWVTFSPWMVHHKLKFISFFGVYVLVFCCTFLQGPPKSVSADVIRTPTGAKSWMWIHCVLIINPVVIFFFFLYFASHENKQETKNRSTLVQFFFFFFFNCALELLKCRVTRTKTRPFRCNTNSDLSPDYWPTCTRATLFPLFEEGYPPVKQLIPKRQPKLQSDYIMTLFKANGDAGLRWSSTQNDDEDKGASTQQVEKVCNSRSNKRLSQIGWDITSDKILNVSAAGWETSTQRNNWTYRIETGLNPRWGKRTSYKIC